MRKSVDFPQPEGPTKTTNSPSSISRLILGMILVAPKDLLTSRSWMLPIVVPPECYFTAPNVRPRTSCFWLNQPMIRIGAIAIVEAADSLAQNSP